MIRGLGVFALLTILCQPMSALSGQEEKKALMVYLGGNHSRLKSLLAQDFQYHFFINNTAKVLSREQDIEALDRIAEDTVDHENVVVQIDRIHEYKSHPGQFRVKFDIYFHDSPKIWPGSFFRGATLMIDQIFIIKLEQAKIARIEEIKGDETTYLAFGKLKTIYLRNTETEKEGDAQVAVDNGKEYIERLFASDSHELLVWKKFIRRGTSADYQYYWRYYWPSNQLIENVRSDN